MATERVRLLLAELLNEPGVSGVLLTHVDQTVGIQLDLQVTDTTKVEVQALFGPDGQSLSFGTKRKHAEIEDDIENEGDALLGMYKQYSGRQLYKLRPDVWTSHGRWAKAYRHLDGIYMKEQKGPGGSNGRVTNRPFVRLFNLNGKDIEAGLVDHPPVNYKRIIISFTRASSAPPTYGAQGMFSRAATAAKAWAALQPEDAPLIVSLPRARVASKWPLSEGQALVGEIRAVLNAAADGVTIELLSVGIDGLTTDVPSLQWLYDTWGQRLEIRLVVVVPSAFPGTLKSFPAHRNGIRYGVFELNDLNKVIADPSFRGFEEYRELIVLLRKIRDDKEDRDEGYLNLSQLTFGRANFQVCPESLHESGVDESQRQSRSLR